MPYGTAYEGQFYQERLKSKASKAPIPVPEPVRPVIEAWRRLCPDPSPDALMFPTLRKGRTQRGRLYRETLETASGYLVVDRTDKAPILFGGF